MVRERKDGKIRALVWLRVHTPAYFQLRHPPPQFHDLQDWPGQEDWTGPMLSSIMTDLAFPVGSLGGEHEKILSEKNTEEF